MGLFRSAIGAPWQETGHLTVTLVDTDGIPGGISVGSVSVSGIGAGTDLAAPANGGNGEAVAQLKRSNIELASIYNNARLDGGFCYYQVAGAGPILAGWVETVHDQTGTITGINIYDTAGALVPTGQLATPGTSTATSSGGGVAVTYSINGGATNQFGAWDIANSQVYPVDGGAAIAIGTAANLATITSIVPEAPSIAVSAYSSFFTAASGVIKSSAGNLRSLVASHTNAAKRYLQIFNLPTAPSAGAVPIFSFPLAGSSATADSGFVVDENFLDETGHAFSNGIAWGYSTTAAIFTSAIGAEVMINGRFA